MGATEPSVNTVEESELDRTETRFLYYTRLVDTLETSRKQVLELANKAKTAPLLNSTRSLVGSSARV